MRRHLRRPEAAEEEVVRLKDSEGNERQGPLPGLIEEMIQDAMARGAFDNLPGKGKPLDLDEDPLGQGDWLVNHILKNHHVLPDWIQLDQEIRADLAWLKEHPDHPGRADRLAEVNRKIDRFNLIVPSLSLQRPRIR